MAAPPLSPTTTLTPAAAFTAPLPQVRAFHRRLTVSLDEKNARLRSLVGGSYRQLLGTADTILQMRSDIEVVEEKLGRVGKGCGRQVIAGMVSNLGKIQGGEDGVKEMGKGRENLGWRARRSVLSMCGVLVGRLLKTSNLVLAAKVLVLGRLLSKPPSNATQADLDFVEEAKRKLGNLRRRLLRGVEKRLQRCDKDSDGKNEDREDILEALAAYALATSSGAKDVLRHFLHIRGEALTLSFDSSSHAPASGIVRALELYTRTLLDVQALMPRRLSEALAKLKIKPLLKDEALRELEGLRLDVCERWFGDEVLFFTPYIRHDDLSSSPSPLQGWAKKASEVLLQGLSKSLESTSDFKTVVGLRTEVLEIWIKEGGEEKGTMLDGLREVFNARLVKLLDSRVHKLHLVATEVEATLRAWQEGVTDSQASLWDPSMLEMEISYGAGLFKQEILARTHGRNDAVSRPFKGYQTWRRLVDEIVSEIELLKKQRWDDDLEDIEDDLTLESRNTLLSTDDPDMLQSRLDACLEKAYEELHEKIASLLSSFWKDESKAVYLLRIIRDIRSELPTKKQALQSFGLSLVPAIHSTLASAISSPPLATFSKYLAHNRRQKVPGRALWEGDPGLPVQPSPATFKLLNALTRSMAKAGGDLWSPSAVVALKGQMRGELGRMWIETLKSVKDDAKATTNGASTNGDEAAESNGHDESEPGSKETGDSNGVQAHDPTQRRDVLVQSLFDVLLLQKAFALPDAVTSKEDDLQKFSRALENEGDLDLDSAARKRLQKAADEYWKRTSLLFGLLG